MEIVGRVASGTPDHDPFPFLVPFQNGARTHAEAPPHFGGNGDLSLGGQLRSGERHV